MTVYKNITSATHTTLKSKTVEEPFIGGARKVIITNNHDTSTTRIRLYIDDDSTEYTIAKTDIPPKTSLVLFVGIGFDASVYDLKLQTSEAGYDITVIIK